MSREQAPKQEHSKAPELDPNKAREQAEKIRNKLEREAKSAAEKHKSHSKEKLKHHAEQKAEKAEDIDSRIRSKTDTDQQKAYNYETSDTLPRALVQARRQLKPAERAFSKVIHNPTVEVVSNIAGGTVARPSGLLWGSFFSFVATTLFFVISKAYGYEYNAFVAIGAFVGGFGLGLVLEFLTRKLHISRN